jgi:response regulator RpfG family c-di-GMP phosphodiesterase
VSGRVDGEVDESVLAEAGVDGIVVKPWMLDELRRVVRLTAELAVLGRDRRHRDIQLLLAALELRHEESAVHTRRVAALAGAAAQRLGIGGDELAALEDAALLHAVGNLGLDDAALATGACADPGRLAAELTLLPLSERATRLLGAVDRLDRTGDTGALRRDHPDLADAILAPPIVSQA